MTGPNPKQAFGDKKPPLGQLPLVALVHGSLAFYDGSLKYGFRNWRKNHVEARTYVEAILRHIQLWAEGEEFARDTNVHNLGGVIASAALLLDAQANGTLIDNREKSQAACDLLHDAEAQVELLKKKQQERVAAKSKPDVETIRHQEQALEAADLLSRLNIQWIEASPNKRDGISSRIAACRDEIVNMAGGVFPPWDPRPVAKGEIWEED